MEEPIVAGLRLVQYVGVALLLGAPLFLAGAGRDLPSRYWARPLTIAAAGLTALGAAGALTAQTAVMAGSWSEALKPGSLSLVAFQTPFGLSMVTRAGAALTALAALALLKTGRTAWTASIVAGLVAAGSFAWSGHAGSTEGAGARLHLAADVLHAVAAAVWLGALAALTLTCLDRGAAQSRETARAFARFSGVGISAVVALAATGLVNSAFLVGPEKIGELGDGLYGRLLLFKLTLFAAMLALAWSNRTRLTPALAAAGPAEAEAALARLRASVLVETALGLAVLAVVAVMGVEAPPGLM
ncbi:copper homeostasis membrane protein CopD [Brevundimonas sp.]|jgi:putative copper resistance protein D|uniref:copper homeostasis membrane protein CopD n=1 Tax=Brevundimonas sp. TaxID=1871086 RepID=UPI002E0F28AA|nr:copper homeostasis membrane protein CopD [Brevundimonas sp.]